MSSSFERHAASAQKKGSPFFLFFSTHNIHVPRVPNARFQGKSGLGARGDAILELDETMGKLLSTLDRLNLRDNTLVVFTSDNGGKQGDGYEDFVNNGHPENGPLRGSKSTLFEGGIRVPFIVRWPGQVKPGSKSDALLCYIDALSSIASLVNQTVPAGAATDSRNRMKEWLGTSPGSADTEYVFHNGGIHGPYALRSGNWKLVQPKGGRAYDDQSTAPEKLQLYDLSKDIGEKNNLAGKHPEKLQELNNRLTAILNNKN